MVAFPNNDKPRQIKERDYELVPKELTVERLSFIGGDTVLSVYGFYNKEISIVHNSNSLPIPHTTKLCIDEVKSLHTFLTEQLKKIDDDTI